jgi:hypothetical protein
VREILDFFMDIFMIKKEERLNIGLTQFRVKQTEKQKEIKQEPKKKELKLSDLMRGSYN